MVDNAMVLACRPLAADLAITKTDGATTEIPGTPVTYTIIASNAGPDPVTGATVADTFPAILSGCTWTCAGAGGGTCTAAGAGQHQRTWSTSRPAARSPTPPPATSSPRPPAPSSTPPPSRAPSPIRPRPTTRATDTDTLTPQADLAITKTDGLTNAALGQATTYTIVVSNAGPATPRARSSPTPSRPSSPARPGPAPARAAAPAPPPARATSPTPPTFRPAAR